MAHHDVVFILHLALAVAVVVSCDQLPDGRQLRQLLLHPSLCQAKQEVNSLSQQERVGQVMYSYLGTLLVDLLIGQLLRYFAAGICLVGVVLAVPAKASGMESMLACN